jgi:hypothetical protein
LLPRLAITLSSVRPGERLARAQKIVIETTSTQVGPTHRGFSGPTAAALAPPPRAS